MYLYQEYLPQNLELVTVVIYVDPALIEGMIFEEFQFDPTLVLEKVPFKRSKGVDPAIPAKKNTGGYCSSFGIATPNTGKVSLAGKCIMLLLYVRKKRGFHLFPFFVTG